jgi:hypothetical protein
MAYVTRVGRSIACEVVPMTKRVGGWIHDEVMFADGSLLAAADGSLLAAANGRSHSFTEGRIPGLGISDGRGSRPGSRKIQEAIVAGSTGHPVSAVTLAPSRASTRRSSRWKPSSLAV